MPCCSGCSGVLTPAGGRWSNAAAARRGVESALETAGVGGLDDDGDESANGGSPDDDGPDDSDDGDDVDGVSTAPGMGELEDGGPSLACALRAHGRVHWKPSRCTFGTRDSLH